MSRLVLIVVVFATVSGCLTLRKRIDPDPIPVASSADRTEGAIREALRREGWAIETLTAGEVYAITEITTLPSPLRSRVAYDDVSVSITWIDDVDPLGESPKEISKRKKAIRRHLRLLSQRVAYFIESADLSVESPAHPDLPE